MQIQSNHLNNNQPPIEPTAIQEEEIETSLLAYDNHEEVIQEEPQIEPETVQAYLEAIAVADNAQSSISDLGYLVTSLAVAGVALLAILSLKQSRDNSFLKDELFACQSQNDFNTGSGPDFFKLPETSSYYGAASQMISNFFLEIPDQACENNEILCKCTPIYSDEVLTSVKKVCIEKEMLNIHSEQSLEQSITLKVGSEHFSGNGTSLLSHGLIYCSENLDMSSRTLSLETNCKGALSNPNLYDNAPFTYLSSESRKAQLLPGKPYEGIYSAHEDLQEGITNEISERFKARFSRPKDFEAYNFPILKRLLDQLEATV